MWVAGAHVLDLYESVTAAQDAFAGSSQSPDRLDHARLVGAATAMLRNWDGNVSREPQARRFPRPRWDWVLVDDVHNAPGSIVALLAELACDGASIVVTGDPDASVQASAEPSPPFPATSPGSSDAARCRCGGATGRAGGSRASRTGSPGRYAWEEGRSRSASPLPRRGRTSSKGAVSSTGRRRTPGSPTPCAKPICWAGRPTPTWRS